MSDSELQHLRDRVDMLEDILGVGRTMVSRLRTAFEIEPDQARILGMLISRQLITKEAIYSMLHGHKPECDQPVWKVIDVQLHRLRKQLRVHDIEFACVIGEGYAMKLEHKLKVRARLGLYEDEVTTAAKASESFYHTATDFPPIALAPPLTEGYVVKGGQNTFPSQVRERPAAPGAISRNNVIGASRG